MHHNNTYEGFFNFQMFVGLSSNACLSTTKLNNKYSI